MNKSSARILKAELLFSARNNTGGKRQDKTHAFQRVSRSLEIRLGGWDVLNAMNATADDG
ncbi:MAG: hypothetical protein ACRCZS_19270 [Chroococcidiopsis sp.]